jgi:hypothetical protein
MRSRGLATPQGQALACMIGARRAWTVEMISSVVIPCSRYRSLRDGHGRAGRWISVSGSPSCRRSTACAWRSKPALQLGSCGSARPSSCTAYDGAGASQTKAAAARSVANRVGFSSVVP